MFILRVLGDTSCIERSCFNSTYNIGITININCVGSGLGKPLQLFTYL